MARRKALTDEAIRETDADARAKKLASLPHCVQDDDAPIVAGTCTEQRSAAVAEAMKEPDVHLRGIKLTAVPKCDDGKPPPPPEPATRPACPDLVAYETSIAEHRRGVAASCTGMTSPDCEREQATISSLNSDLARCRAGQAVGPPRDADILVYAPPMVPGPGLVGYVALEAGGAKPLNDDDLARTMGLSPSAALRGDLTWGGVGFGASFEYVDGRILPDNTLFLPSGLVQHLHTFRGIIEGFGESAVSDSVTVCGRFGAGGEFAYFDYNAPTFYAGGWTHSWAVEAAGSVWFRIQRSTELGLTLALPGEFRSSTDAMDATHYHLDMYIMLAIGLRFRAR
jgi:hypothetical protein